MCRRAEAARKEKKSRKRNLALLSFGEDAAAEEQHLTGLGDKAKIKSAHDVGEDERWVGGTGMCLG